VKAAGLAACLALLGAVHVRAHAKPPPDRTPPRQPASSSRAEARSAPWPMLPSVARVRVEAARDRVVVVEELNLPRGDWRAGGLDPYVAFGAPGPPIAIDAHLLTAQPDTLEPRQDDPGEALSVEPAVRRTSGAQLLLGRPQMAGVVVHIRDADLRRAYAASDLVTLRMRSLLTPPAADASGARDVVVRLGIAGDLPLTLGRVQVLSAEARPWITRAQATLCGPDADERPLALTLLPKAAEGAPDAEAGASTDAPIAPVMSVRHASDDLCIRWWSLP
jgi:hypothetical protein